MVTSSSRRICLFGTFDATRHPRVEVLEAGLRAHGFDVVRCNVPWAASTADRVRAIKDPIMAARLVGRLVRAWLRLRRLARTVGSADIVLTGYLGVFDIHLARRWWPEAVQVLDHLAPVEATLSDRTGSRGLRQLAGSLLDGAACRAADIVVVDTDEHRPSSKGVVVPVGAPEQWFDHAVDRPATDGPLRVVFFGLYTPLQGTETIARALRALCHAGIAFEMTLIGSGQDRPAVRSLLAGTPGVTWVDWVEPGELPGVIASHDVCLGIFGTTEKAGRVVPNKLFQGAAVGCALVTSDTPPQRRLLVQGARFVPAGDEAALAAALADLATDRGACAELGAAAHDLARQEFRPERVVMDLVSALSDG